MDEVFRFLFLRPPAPAKAVVVRPSGPFAAALANVAGNSDERRAAIKTVATQYLASGAAIGDVAALPHTEKLRQLGVYLQGLAGAKPDDVATKVKDLFGKEANALVAADDFIKTRERLSDNLIAAKLLSRDASVEAKDFEALLRVIDLIRRVVEKDVDLDVSGAVQSALWRPTSIGAAVALPIPGPRTPTWPEKPGGGVAPDKLRDKLAVLEAARDNLLRLGPKSFSLPKDRPADPPPVVEPGPAEILRLRLLERIKAGQIDEAGKVHAGTVLDDVRATDTVGTTSAPSLATADRLLLTADAAGGLSDGTKAALKSLGVDPARTPLPLAVQQIGYELAGTHAEYATTLSSGTSYVLMGTYLYNTGLVGVAFSPGMSLAAVPTTHGTVKPVGVGDLLVVRQQLKRYEGGEVGYIENVLQGEVREREHRRSRTTEETTTVEVETKTDEERDTQTTERFELKREASTVIKDDMSFKAGLALSGSYGPTIEFKASTDFAMNHAKEEASKTASTYSKEVTERATSKISERRREEHILRTLEVFEERNKHGFQNVPGTGNISGIYQWVDKVYEAQVFNYGRRMMFDIMVPEPAAFWIYANSHAPKPGATLTKPVPFNLKPDQIQDYNYTYYTNLYQVAGVKPPPEPFRTIAKTFEGALTSDQAAGTKTAELALPDGYEAVTGYAAIQAGFWSNHAGNWSVGLAFGKEWWRQQNGSYLNHYFTLDNEVGAIAIGIYLFGVSSWFVSLEVDCKRSARSYTSWQLETHAAIMQAYLKLDRDYRDELAALEVQAASQVQGRNPDENRIIERTELKKQAISVLTAQHFDMFGAIQFSPQGYPQPNLTEADAEGRYVRFFEQAFEWENMMYLFYPYYWGRKNNWTVTALAQDVDTQFAEFLKAGSARLVVPVRPGFEAAIAHFMDNGEIWEGADPPTLTSPLYVSIIDEIKERTQAPGKEVAQGDPWDVRLPTTLVRLRDDSSLPTWAKQPDGTWLPN